MSRRVYTVIRTWVPNCITYVVGYYNWRGKWKPVSDHYAIPERGQTKGEAIRHAERSAVREADRRNHESRP